MASPRASIFSAHILITAKGATTRHCPLSCNVPIAMRAQAPCRRRDEHDREHRGCCGPLPAWRGGRPHGLLRSRPDTDRGAVRRPAIFCPTAHCSCCQPIVLTRLSRRRSIQRHCKRRSVSRSRARRITAIKAFAKRRRRRGAHPILCPSRDAARCISAAMPQPMLSLSQIEWPRHIETGRKPWTRH
jgi:hypothetical protein